MSVPVRPPNGPHTLVTAGTSVAYVFTDAGVQTTFGLLTWRDGPPLHLECGDVGITLYDDGHFVAVNGGVSYAGTWT